MTRESHSLLEQSTVILEALADPEETEALALAAKVADVEYDIAFAKAKLLARSEGTTNPTLIVAQATADPGVQVFAMKAAVAKAVWEARQEAARNARSALEGRRSINVNQRAIV